MYEKNINIKDAVEKPRFHHQWLPDAIFFEYNNFSNETLLDLEDRGHSYYFRPSIGEANSIKIKYLYDSDKVKNKEQIYSGAADSRRGASALGY